VTKPRGSDKPRRPPRPFAVELASAFLVVNGIISAITSVNIVWSLSQTNAGLEPLAALTLAIGVATVVLGILIRYGHAWIVTLNVTAVAGFLELTAGSDAGVIVGVLDVLVVLALLATRPWFAWSAKTAGANAVMDDEA
jgi:hypothetical protein